MIMTVISISSSGLRKRRALITGGAKYRKYGIDYYQNEKLCFLVKTVVMSLSNRK